MGRSCEQQLEIGDQGSLGAQLPCVLEQTRQVRLPEISTQRMCCRAGTDLMSQSMDIDGRPLAIGDPEPLIDAGIDTNTTDIERRSTEDMHNGRWVVDGGRSCPSADCETDMRGFIRP